MTYFSGKIYITKIQEEISKSLIFIAYLMNQLDNRKWKQNENFHKFGLNSAF